MIEIIPNWHPIFVHFTVALISTSLGLFVVSFLLGEGECCQQVQTVAKWNLWIGAGVSVLTLAAGLYAYNTVTHDVPSHAAMTEHRNWAFVTLIVIALLAVWSAVRHRKGLAMNVPFLVVFLFCGALLGATAWHGGEVVYRYGLGVMSIPKTDSHDHSANDHEDEVVMDAPHGDDHDH